MVNGSATVMMPMPDRDDLDENPITRVHLADVATACPSARMS